MGERRAIKVLLQLLVGTSLRMVIIDPNSDYVRLAEVRDTAEPAVAAAYAVAARGVSVWQNDPGAEHPLQLQLRDIDAASQDAVLGLDPIRDRGEYAGSTVLEGDPQPFRQTKAGWLLTRLPLARPADPRH